MRSNAPVPNVLRTCRILALLSLAACPRTSSQQAPATESVPIVANQAPSQAPPAKETPPVPNAWSPIVDDLQIQAVVPPGPASPGAALPITLTFRNTGSTLRRIYLLQSEPFRAMQSTFFLELPAAGPSMQPEPRPHGIVVTEADFHELPPGGTRSFTPTLQLPADLAPGTLWVRWQYSNRVDQWKGGIQTLDGPTKELFGGQRIPGIWVGELEVRFAVEVGPR
jgi:hypothetical protein